MDIRHHLDHKPIVARPPDTLYRFKKMVRRNKAVFVSAGAVAAALLLGTIVSTLLAARAIRAERDAKMSQINEIRMRRTAQDQESKWRRWAYASDIDLIQQSLANNRIGRAREILDRQRHRFDQQVPLGWEWRYLWGQCQSEA